jgi:hypothetical protein
MIVSSLLSGALDIPALAGMSESHLVTLARLQPDIGRRFPALRHARAPRGDGGTGEPSFSWRLYDALATLVTLICEDAPLVVAIDDALWCDRESSTLLLQLMGRSSSLPVMWLLSAPADVRSERPHPLLHRTGQVAPFTRLRLAPLSPLAIERMLAEWSGAAGEWGPFAARIHAVSAGLPAHVVAAVEEAAQRCDLNSAALRAAMPEVPKPHRRLGARIDALAELDRELLLSLALVSEMTGDDAPGGMGEQSVVQVDTLSHVHGISRLRAARVGGMLADARLADELPDGFRCASPSLAAYTVSSCSRLVADELRRRLKRWHLAT